MTKQQAMTAYSEIMSAETETLPRIQALAVVALNGDLTPAGVDYIVSRIHDLASSPEWSPRILGRFWRDPIA